jgi:GDP-4-dehydro-6-deoxy-D-mannose reductase
MKRVLVTGAGGFLGGAICRRLAGRDDLEVVQSARASGAAAVALDLSNRYAVATLIARVRPDVVVHAAGRAHGSAGALHVDNVIATDNLAAALGTISPPSGIVLLSSAAQYGRSQSQTPWRESGPCDPISDYGVSKAHAESAAYAEAARSGLRVTALRIFNVVAAEPQGDHSLPDFQRKLAMAMAEPSPWQVQMGRLTAIRDFVAVADVVEAVERVIDLDIWGRAINCCTGVGRPVGALLDSMARYVADEAHGVVAIAEDGPPPALDWSVGDPTVCQARLGFTPSSDLTALIAEAAAWVREAAAARANA